MNYTHEKIMFALHGSGHVGIIGNEKADLKAKETTGTSIFAICP